MSNAVNSKNKKFTALAWTLAILVLAVAIPLNLIFERLNITADMTPNSLYTLTPTTTKMLDQYDQQGIVVDVYFLGKLEEMENDPEMLAMYRTLIEYDKFNCFHLIDIDPDTEPQLVKNLDPTGEYKLTDYDFLFKRDQFVKRIPASLMYTYGTAENAKGETIVTNAEFRAENYFTGAMYSVVTGEEPVVYFLEGHGEHGLDEMTTLKANLANYNYRAKSLNLMNAESVPEDACMIVCAGPTRDISEEEFQKLNDYLDKGGNLSLLMTPNPAKLSYSYLETIMYRFCIGMDYNTIYETDAARHVSGNNQIYMVDLVPAVEEAEIDLTADLLANKAIIPYMPSARSFYQQYNENYTTCQVGDLLRTATTAMADPCGGTLEDPESVTGKQQSLAMYSQDSLRNNAKLAVFGSAEFLLDTSMTTNYYIQPTYLYVSTITWMYNSDVDMNIDNKSKTYDELPINSSGTAKTYMALFLAAPIVIALIGVVVWLRRKDA